MTGQDYPTHEQQGPADQVQPQPLQSPHPAQPLQQIQPPQQGGAQEGELLQVESPLAMTFSADDFRTEIKRVKRAHKIRIALLAIVALVACLCIAAAVVVGVPSSLQEVATSDMEPVLSPGQTVAVKVREKVPDGSIVAYMDEGGAIQMKRVVASAGEWVNIASDGSVVVSAISLEANASANSGESAVIASRQVPENAYFVLADRESGALEALYRTENFVSYSQVVGQVTFRLWPVGSLGPVL